MKTMNDGGLAFPGSRYEDVKYANGDTRNALVHYGGMTLRDNIAIHVLPALIAITAAGQHSGNRRDGESFPEAFAREAYEIADAMVAAALSPSHPEERGE